jgi:RNA polymerase sigma-70 factor (ECF subfamily)
MPSDYDLIQLVRARDPTAFEALLARYREPVRRHLGRILRDDAAAEDVTQEAFLRVWTNADQWNGRGAFKSWLFRIAANLALNHLRTVRRRPQQPLENPPDVFDEEGEELPAPGWLVDTISLGPEAALEQSERRRTLRRLVNDLPEEKREVLRLVHDAELELREVAQRLGVPEGAVKSRLHYATKRLAREWRELEDEGETG